MAAESPSTYKPTADAYTGMLTISLIALVTGCVLLFLDFSQYPERNPPKPSAFAPAKKDEPVAPVDPNKDAPAKDAPAKDAPAKDAAAKDAEMKDKEPAKDKDKDKEPAKDKDEKKDDEKDKKASLDALPGIPAAAEPLRLVSAAPIFVERFSGLSPRSQRVIRRPETQEASLSR